MKLKINEIYCSVEKTFQQGKIDEIKHSLNH
jgi:hypothetical protein